MIMELTVFRWGNEKVGFLKRTSVATFIAITCEKRMKIPNSTYK